MRFIATYMVCPGPKDYNEVVAVVAAVVVHALSSGTPRVRLIQLQCSTRALTKRDMCSLMFDRSPSSWADVVTASSLCKNNNNHS